MTLNTLVPLPQIFNNKSINNLNVFFIIDCPVLFLVLNALFGLYVYSVDVPWPIGFYFLLLHIMLTFLLLLHIMVIYFLL